MRSPFIKLAIGCIMLGVGFVVSMQAERELVAKFAGPCEDCDEDEAAKVEPGIDEDIKSFLDGGE
jgi:hypothetical protein